MHNIHTVTDFDLVMLKKSTEAFLTDFLKPELSVQKLKQCISIQSSIRTLLERKPI